MTDDRLLGSTGQALGHQAVEKMGKYSLAVHAKNYEVWLAYNLRSHHELCRELNALLKAGHTLTQHDMEDLHERHFCSTELSARVMDTGSRIAHEIADALDALKKAGVSTGRYNETLQVATGALSGPLDGEGLKRLIAGLGSATTAMSRENASLSTQLTQSSSEMEKLRLSLREARAQALTDALTGIANRKLFDETLQLRRQEAEVDKTDLCLIMADIDHFKTFNDSWGHQTGDQVIRFVASTLSKFALPDHLVARYGGEEFAMIMPRTSLGQAARLAEQVRLSVESKRLVRRSSNEMIDAVTVSFGVALHAPGQTVSQLIARADECLYAAKHNGRNRVMSETSPAPFAIAIAGTVNSPK